MLVAVPLLNGNSLVDGALQLDIRREGHRHEKRDLRVSLRIGG